MERRPLSISGISELSRSRAQMPRTADLIYRELHRDIVSMKLKPNSKVTEKDLLAHFGVSRTPLRQAIVRLADEGLITVFPQAGTFVAPIPVRILLESILIRKALEAVVAETVARVAVDDDIALLDHNLIEQENALRTGDLSEFHRIDSEFHRLVGRISGLFTIVTTIEHVRAQIDRYRLLTLPQQGRLERVITEHRAVRDAFAAKDAEKAGSMMARHIGQMYDEVEALKTLDKDYFHDDRDKGEKL
ncbi:GntR family transcriptional regulator [Brucellaceae bacterium C25G]